MAAELVGGALLSAFLQVAFDKLASPQFLEFFRGRKLDDKLLGNLNIMLHSINALAHDAEQKQFTDPHVKAWLFSVKEALFDAEDLLVEIDYELTRCQVEAESEPHTFTYKVSNFFNSTFNSFNKKIESEMKEVLEKLEYLAKQKGALGLKEGTYSGDRSGIKVSQKLPSSSLAVESVIYGRDADKEMIFNWLTSDTDNHNHLSILSIVGMGGSGKTTLAQHVYNDQRMETKFDIRAWVCVSDHFDVFTVTKTILEAITKSKDDSGDLEMVHGRLKGKVSGKKFLLVLDDVWNEKLEEWEAVRTPLSYGAPGSRILVTTRIEKVASNMRCEVHHLKQLEENECWKVFNKQALKDDDLELNDEKKEIGRRIVEKCKGLPLALKTIGSLLRTKSSILDWKSVLESHIWDLSKEVELMPALLLSYQHLPSHLKRCFAYCALFPKDHEFLKEELILLWMGEGFLYHSQQNKNLLEIGEQYFDDLLTRSFFFPSSFELHFVMHDLLNDLAKYVCADFCFRLKFDKGNCIPKITRHFSFAHDDIRYFDSFGSLTDAKRLRSFVQITNDCLFPGLPGPFEILISEVFSKLKFLRVLSLKGYYGLKEVSDSVGNLKHLHSLDLSSTRIQKLPDSVGLLYNLLILRLNGCLNLKELPSSLHKLTKLRCLEFERTGVTKIPMHFAELKNLHVLNMFCVGRNSEFSTKELGGINLHGRLSINELQNIVNPSDALEANLKNKHLVELNLIWNSNHIPDDPRKEKKVLENLQPSNQLERFSIRSYCGTQFPSWVFDNSLSNLVSLELKDCKYILCLPPLGLLSSLKTLEITALNGIVSIGVEFYGNNTSSFKSLERLLFFDMKEWEEWECKTTSFPRLEELVIHDCPKLKGLSEQLLHLKALSIETCDNLIIREHNVDTSALQWLKTHSCPLVNIPMTHYDFIQDMTIVGGCDSLTIFQLDFFPMLSLLVLSGCQNLQKISQEHAHNHLKELSIYECPQFESFTNEGLSAPLVQIIDIRQAENLKLLPKRMQILLPSLTELEIINCPKVEKFPDGGLPSNVKHLSLSSLKLIAFLRENLDVNTCLESLSIDSLDVESFPDDVLLPPSLTSLKIIRCQNLKKLDYKLLYHLSSLELGDCPNLQCLPEEGLPKSISSLQIWSCPLLEQRCQKPEGKD
ncbi:hypothetical protein V8G54_012544 [Vigna mungo]|uniref:Disease resistance RPP13-like protein 1 n=1 Tax=Vigna mungo TaxID=3915 RepID=A0AAQ3NUX5_VIGMU